MPNIHWFQLLKYELPFSVLHGGNSVNSVCSITLHLSRRNQTWRVLSCFITCPKTTMSFKCHSFNHSYYISVSASYTVTVKVWNAQLYLYLKLRSDMHRCPDILPNFSGAAVCENANFGADILRKRSCQSPGTVTATRPSEPM